MRGHAVVSVRGIGEVETERRHRPAAEDTDGVERGAGPDVAGAPPRGRPHLAGTVGHHDGVGAGHRAPCQEAAEHVDGFEVPAERLPRGDHRVDQAGLAEVGEEPGEPRREGRAVGHHVDHAFGPGRHRPGARSAEHRMERDPHHRGAVEPVRGIKGRAVRAALFLDGLDLGLERRVPELHHVAGRRRIEVVLALHRHHEVPAAGAQAQGTRGRVQHDRVPDGGRPGQLRVRQGPLGEPLDLDLELEHAGAGLGRAGHDPPAEPDHLGGMLAAMHPLERLVNLVAFLLETGRALTFEEIQSVLPAYDQADRASAKRQFERDKETLRQIGIPVETVATDAWEVGEGYRIPKERYELPDISFTADAVAALFVAAHAPGRGGGQGRAGPRDVDAWALVCRGGAWYLVGWDRGRKEPRSFRLSRIASGIKDAGTGEPPPEGFKGSEQLRAGPWGLGGPETTARVAFSPKVAWWALGGVPGARTLRTGRDGWTEAEVPAAAGEAFVSWILSFGPDARVLAPRAVRAAVVEALEAARAAL